MEQVWFHVDMDAFYAAVEQNDNPEYRGKPLIVGGTSNRGVVSACSYEAREYKVHSAMPMYRAKQLCPHAIIVRGNLKRYNEVSKEILKILKSFSPTVQQISIDEAFLDMSGTERLFGKPRQAAILLKNEVKNQSGLTISVGIGPSKFIAKMASGYDKPDGLVRVSKGNEINFVDTIGLKKLWGIGQSTLNDLYKHNITTVKQIRELSLEYLQTTFGTSTGQYLYKVSRGIDPGIHTGVTKSRSISTEQTFVVDVDDKETLLENLLAMSHEVMFRLLEEDLNSCTVALKIRQSDFTTNTIQTTSDSPINSADQVFAMGKDLLEKRFKSGDKIRLLGIGLYNVKERGELVQSELFDDPYEKKRSLEKTILELSKKGQKLQKATLVKPKNNK